jgi:transcriptional regulator with XRE-family HTH domain
MSAKIANGSQVDFAELHRHPVGMGPQEPALTPLGALLEEARLRKALSKREAARRAGISEGRWRQVVTGIQKAGTVNVAVNPRANTVVAMARAVDVDPEAALVAAGFPPDALQSTGGPGHWVDTLAEVQAIADNKDRSPGLRAWARTQVKQIEDLIAAARAEEEARRRQAS